MNLIKKNYGFKKINSQRKKDAIKINELNKITKIFGKKHTGMAQNSQSFNLWIRCKKLIIKMTKKKDEFFKQNIFSKSFYIIAKSFLSCRK